MKFDDDTCAKNLKSLMMSKYKVLEFKNEKTSGNFSDDDVLRINEAFTSPLKRVIFPTPVLEEVYKKGKLTLSILIIGVEIIQEDRSIAIEAAIVRIMKSRRKLDHTSLV